MSYWTDQAKKLDRGLLDTNWAGILRQTLKDSSLELKGDDLEAYILCRVNDATKDFDRALEDGMDEQTAREIAMETLIPVFDDSDEESEDWELEGGVEDAIGGLEDWLGKKKDD
jgi:hypothetical protein